MVMNKEIAHSYQFGAFQVDVKERRLMRYAKAIPLTPKVFDTLLVLLENKGRTLDKDELMRRLWPDTFVEESSLSQNIFQLRKALGEGEAGAQYIETISKRGYRFCASVRTLPFDAVEELVIKRHSETSVAIEQETQTSSDRESTEPHLPQAHPEFSLRRLPTSQLALLGSITLIVAIAIGGFLRQQSRAKSSRYINGEIKTLAVLPFRSLDQASEDDQMRLGMTDALISRLSNLRPITVRPTSATLNFISPKQNALDAGRQLRVDAVLDGTIQRVGDRLRVNVQLVRVRDGAAIWSEKFDEQSTDIFAIQDSISEQVSMKLVGRLSANATRGPATRYTKDTEAYQEYIRGRYFWNKRSEEGFQKGIEHFKRAIEIDPAYALAYAGLADCYMFLAAGQFGDTAPGKNFERARATAKKALELDENLAEAQTTLAMIDSDYDGNWPEAEKAYLRAIELNPDYATAHHWYALDLLAAEHFDQAVIEMKKAQELDPLSLPSNLALGQIYFYLRRYDDAIKQLQQTLELDADHAGSRIYLGLAYEQKGMLNEALAEFDKVLTAYKNNLAAVSARAHTQAIMHQRDQAKTTLEELTKRDPIRPLVICEIGAINTALGNKAEAFRWLEKLSDIHLKSVVIRLKFDPRLDELRADPRFKLSE